MGQGAIHYVTAIPNRIRHFPDKASQKYAQEFPSSHNAAGALKYVIPFFVSAIARSSPSTICSWPVVQQQIGQAISLIYVVFS